MDPCSVGVTCGIADGIAVAAARSADGVIRPSPRGKPPRSEHLGRAHGDRRGRAHGKTARSRNALGRKSGHPCVLLLLRRKRPVVRLPLCGVQTLDEGRRRPSDDPDRLDRP